MSQVCGDRNEEPKRVGAVVPDNVAASLPTHCIAAAKWWSVQCLPTLGAQERRSRTMRAKVGEQVVECDVPCLHPDGPDAGSTLLCALARQDGTAHGHDSAHPRGIVAAEATNDGRVNVVTATVGQALAGVSEAVA